MAFGAQDSVRQVVHAALAYEAARIAEIEFGLGSNPCITEATPLQLAREELDSAVNAYAQEVLLL